MYRINMIQSLTNMHSCILFIMSQSSFDNNSQNIATFVSNNMILYYNTNSSASKHQLVGMKM